MIRLAVLPGLFVLVSVAVGQAQQVNCDSALTQSDMTHCAVSQWQAADAALNDAYHAARTVMRRIDADLPPAARGAEVNLRDGQRAWLTFRDKTCAAEGFLMRGGSAEPMLVHGCLARLSAQRAADLSVLAQQY